MSPREKPSFYLYSNGYSPTRITLGTLVYRDYANPDHRAISFPKISENELVDQKLASITNASGCWTTAKASKYGLGVQRLSPVSITPSYATSLQKIIVAENGRRVVLNDPDKFFEDRVLKNLEIRKRLTVWLTAAKASYLFKKVTFQRPKVYCVTGIYEFSGVRAWANSSRVTVWDFNVSPEVIPLGQRIGPFSDGKILAATVLMPEASVWAARFHQLDVAYLCRALEGEASLPATIYLRPDVTDPSGGLMAGSGGQYGETDRKELTGPDIKSATVAKLRLCEMVEEMADNYKDDDDYSHAFGVAERRTEEDAEASEEDDE